MFTGIVEETGIVQEFRKGGNSGRIKIACHTVLKGTKCGDSIAVNGICLTVTDLCECCFTADVMAETTRRSALSQIEVGESVNLERALSLSDRLGGHIVSGHIDGTGVIESITREENAYWYRIHAKPEIMKYIVEKGSVTVDGISLTVANCSKDTFSVSVIPTTRAQTTMGNRKVGDKVNLENDIIGKYVARLLGVGEDESGLTMEFLEEYGF
ncbi:MAG: riboflavin synthase [Agathobacter sp.]|uniref:riboflavin synthase n=1 Tax=Agathobacter sp. TaxID=2021311 RepID=UPI00257B4345|nr:riboflavin synthase [Agathobacter sp.]MBQ1682582.1 riboflavin synthase [Agathobacter sp.]